MLPPGPVDEAARDELAQRLAPVSISYLRKLLRDSGVSLSPLVEGVRQDDLPSLERTLLALEREYSEARAAGDRARATRCRRLVIESRDHARLASRRHPEKHEMIEWMTVWLENPGIFPAWIELRKAAR